LLGCSLFFLSDSEDALTANAVMTTTLEINNNLTTTTTTTTTTTVTIDNSPSTPSGGGYAPPPTGQTTPDDGDYYDETDTTGGDSGSVEENKCPDWDCSYWTKCNNGERSKVCVDISGCGYEPLIQVEGCEPDYVYVEEDTEGEYPIDIEKAAETEKPAIIGCVDSSKTNLILSSFIVVVVIFILFNEMRIIGRETSLLRDPKKYIKHIGLGIIIGATGFVYFLYSLFLHLKDCTDVGKTEYNMLLITLGLAFLGVLIFIIRRSIYLLKPVSVYLRK
jgi:hypothetical protein